MTDQTCPTCGSPVTVQSSGEGTSYYVPEIDRLREAGIRVGMYCCGFSRATATEMFDRELGRVSAALDEEDAR